MIQKDKAKAQLERQRDELQQRIANAQDAERAETGQGETDNAHEWENADLRSNLLDEATNELQAVEAALARIEDGTYGICANCGKEISAERFEVVPEAVVCAKCAREMTEGETRE